MKQFEYAKITDAEESNALGVIVLQTDETLEPELRAMLPEKVKLFHTRIPSGAEVTEETLAQMEQGIPAAASLLPEHANICVVAYACTSGTTIIGEQVVADAVRSVMPNVAVTNPLSAVKAKLKDLGAKRVGILTPYVPKVSAAMIAHLENEGFEIVSSGSFFEAEEKNVVRISNHSITAALMEIGAGDCDVVFASCTNLPTVTLLDDVSAKLGKPVISSNSALAWHMQKLLDQAI